MPLRLTPTRFTLPLTTILIVVVALVPRIAPWQQVFADGQLYLFDPDCHIRIRNVLVLLANFPRPYVHDYYQGFPVGTGVIAIPLIEYLIAAIAFPWQKLIDIPRVLPPVLAILPALLGALTAIAVFRWLLRFFPLPVAAGGALTLALFPPAIDATLLGRFDNEMIEPLMFLLTTLAYLRTYDRPKNFGNWILAGVTGFIFLLTWRGATLPLALIGADVGRRMLMPGASVNGSRKEVGYGGAAFWGTISSLVALVCLFDIWGTGHSFSFNIVSWFHVLLFLLAAVMQLALAQLLAPPPRHKPFLVACTLILSAGAWIMIDHLVVGATMLGGGNAWIETIVQYQAPTPKQWLIYYGPLALAAPMLILISSGAGLDRGRSIFFVLAALALVLLALFRLRYGHYLGLVAAVAFAITLQRLLSSQRDTVLRRWRTNIGTLILLALALLPPALQAGALLTERPNPLRGDLTETLHWLRDTRPTPGNPWRPDILPDYGVASRWDYSGWIATVAERPALATAFGTEAYGMQETARLLLANELSETLEILHRNRIRYIVLDKLIGDLEMYANLIGDQRVLFRRGAGQAIFPSADAFGLVSSRLYFADGTARSVGPLAFAPVESLRLVHESATSANVFGFPWDIRRIKVFELAHATRLLVFGPTGTLVTLEQPVQTNRKRQFVYHIEKQIPTTGNVEFLIPYGPKTIPEAVGAIGATVISARGHRLELPSVSTQRTDTSDYLEITLP